MERAKYYRYLFVPGTTLEPIFAFNSIGIKDYSPKSVGFGDLERRLATIESITTSEAWALGEHFTAADVVFGGFLDFAVQAGWIQVRLHWRKVASQLIARSLSLSMLT